MSNVNAEPVVDAETVLSTFIEGRRDRHSNEANAFELKELVVSFLSIAHSAVSGVMSFCSESPLTSVEREKRLAVAIGCAAYVSSMLQSFNSAYGFSARAKAHRTASTEYGELTTPVKTADLENVMEKVLDIGARCRYYVYTTTLAEDGAEDFNKFMETDLVRARSWETWELWLVAVSIILSFLSGVLSFLVTSTLIASETSTSPSDSDTEFTDTQNGFLLTASCLAVFTVLLQACWYIGKHRGWSVAAAPVMPEQETDYDRIVHSRADLHLRAARRFIQVEVLVWISCIIFAAAGVMGLSVAVEREKWLTVFIGCAAFASSMLQCFSIAYLSSVRAKAHSEAVGEYEQLGEWMRSKRISIEVFTRGILNIRARCRCFPPEMEDYLEANDNLESRAGHGYDLHRSRKLEEIKTLRDDHLTKARSYEWGKRILMLFSILFSFASGVLGFLVTSTLIASGSDPEFTDTQNEFLLAVSCLAGGTMTLQGIEKAFGWAVKGGDHRTAAEAYNNLLTKTQLLPEQMSRRESLMRISGEIHSIQSKSISITRIEGCWGRVLERMQELLWGDVRTAGIRLDRDSAGDV